MGRLRLKRTFVYLRPCKGLCRTDMFVYKVYDGAMSKWPTVSITVGQITAKDDSYAVAPAHVEGSVAPGVLGNVRSQWQTPHAQFGKGTPGLDHWSFVARWLVHIQTKCWFYWHRQFTYQATDGYRTQLSRL